MHVHVASLERTTEGSVKRVHSDNAKAFLSMTSASKMMGIQLTTSSLYSPQSNGVSERKNWLLLIKARALLKERQLNGRYWGKALLHAAFLHNSLTSLALKFKTLLKSLLGALPYNSKKKTFGCATYSSQPSSTIQSNLEDHSKSGIYLGTRNGHFGTHVWRENMSVVSKHASFDERFFPRRKLEDAYSYISAEKMIPYH